MAVLGLVLCLFGKGDFSITKLYMRHAIHRKDEAMKIGSWNRPFALIAHLPPWEGGVVESRGVQIANRRLHAGE